MWRIIFCRRFLDHVAITQRVDTVCMYEGVEGRPNRETRPEGIKVQDSCYYGLVVSWDIRPFDVLIPPESIYAPGRIQTSV